MIKLIKSFLRTIGLLKHEDVLTNVIPNGNDLIVCKSINDTSTSPLELKIELVREVIVSDISKIDSLEDTKIIEKRLVEVQDKKIEIKKVTSKEIKDGVKKIVKKEIPKKEIRTKKKEVKKK